MSSLDRLRVGTTSYVLPADLLTNARLLTPLVDDVELLLFEAHPTALPSPADVDELGRLAADGGCGYTVHLPLGLALGDPSRVRRGGAVAWALSVMRLTQPLSPRAFVVHPELPAGPTSAGLAGLQDSLSRLRDRAGGVPLAVENLGGRDFAPVATLVEELDLGVVFDVGHLLLAGGDPQEHLAAYGHRLRVVHLHGVAAGQDHQPASAFAPAALCALLEGFAAAGAGAGEPPLVVTLEVFGRSPTVESLAAVAAVWPEGPRAERLRAAAAAIRLAPEPPGVP